MLRHLVLAGALVASAASAASAQEAAPPSRSAAVLRRAFHARYGLSPGAWRRQFGRALR